MSFDVSNIALDLLGGGGVGSGVKLYKWLTEINNATETAPTGRNIYGDKVIRCKKKRVVSNYIIPHRYNDFRDYQSTYILYLPYASSLNLNASDVVGQALTIDCFLDVRNGDIKYTIWIGGTVISTVIGKIRVDMPVTRVEHNTDLVQLAQGGLTTTTSAVNGAVSGASVGGAIGGVVGGVASAISTGAPMLSNFAKPNPCTVNGVYSGGSSIDDPKDIYLIEYVPTIEIDNSIRSKYGKPCNKVDTLGNNTGYVECSEVDIIGLASEEEKAEIKQRLLQGIYI